METLRWTFMIPLFLITFGTSAAYPQEAQPEGTALQDDGSADVPVSDTEGSTNNQLTEDEQILLILGSQEPDEEAPSVTSSSPPTTDKPASKDEKVEERYEPYWINLATILEGSLSANQPGVFRIGVGPQFFVVEGFMTLTPALYFVSGINSYDGPKTFAQGPDNSIFSYEYRATGKPIVVYGVGAALTWAINPWSFKNGRVGFYILGGIDYFVPQYEYRNYDPALTARVEAGIDLWGYFDSGVQVGLSVGLLGNTTVLSGTSNFNGTSIGLTCALTVITDIRHLMNQSKKSAENSEVTE